MGEIPSVDEKLSQKLMLRQTKGGTYNSIPRTEDVLSELAGEHGWEDDAQNHGHGEYIANVTKVGEYCKANGIKDQSEIEQLISSAEVEDN